MTFREIMENNGYEVQTTFWEDFSIADRFGISAIKETYNRAFNEWKDNCKYLTELTLVLNHKIWQYDEKNRRWGNFIISFGKKQTNMQGIILKIVMQVIFFM